MSAAYFFNSLCQPQHLAAPSEKSGEGYFIVTRRTMKNGEAAINAI